MECLTDPAPVWDRPPLPSLRRPGGLSSYPARSEGSWAPGHPCTPALHAGALAPPHRSLPLPLMLTALLGPARDGAERGPPEPFEEDEAAAAAAAG